MKVLFFVVYPKTNASARYRVYKYLDYLQQKDIEYTVCPPMSDSLFRYLYQTRNPFKKMLFYITTYLVRLAQLPKVLTHDVIFIHQGLCYLGPPFLEYAIAKLNKNIIFDTDDANFAKPIFATGIGARFHDRRRIEKLSKLARHVIVSVDFIKQYVAQFNPDVTVMPTSIDLERYTLKDDTSQNDCVVIGWMGNASGLIYLKSLTPVMQRLAKTYNIVVKIISSETVEIPGVTTIFCRWSLQNEISDIQSLDIGIMPLANTEFERGKAGFKLIQYMGVGLPVVCSPVGINAMLVKDGVNGFLGRSEEEWYEKLASLIENAKLRKIMGKEGRKSIEGRFTIEANAPRFVELIKTAALQHST